MYTYQRLKDLIEDKDLSQTDIAKILAFMIAGSKKGISYIWNLMK